MKRLLFFLTLTASTYAQENQVNDYWFNGAEISSYKLEQAKYGKTYPGHAELIFVTESFLLDKQVKNESNRANATTVLKLNSLTTFNTGIYPNRTMTSTFRPMDLAKFPHALKSVSSIQDWCGQSFQQMNYKKNGWAVELRSYFESEADKNLKLDKVHAEDELWLTLRLDPKKLPVGEIDVIPGAIYTRLYHQKIAGLPARASLDQTGDTSIYTLAYPGIRRTLTIYFDTKFPYLIQKWTDDTLEGTTKAILVKRLTNTPYWNYSRPQDAEKRKQLGLDPVAN